MKNIYVVFESGKLTGFVFYPDDEQLENLCSLCDDCFNYQEIDKIEYPSFDFLKNFAKAVLLYDKVINSENNTINSNWISLHDIKVYSR